MPGPFSSRAILGLIFFMAEFGKCLVRRYSTHNATLSSPCSELPSIWSLWAGVTVPLLSWWQAHCPGGLACAAGTSRFGRCTGVVTFGHLLAEPLYEFHTHVPTHSRLPAGDARADDRLSWSWLTRRRTRTQVLPNHRMRRRGGRVLRGGAKGSSSLMRNVGRHSCGRRRAMTNLTTQTESLFDR